MVNKKNSISLKVLWFQVGEQGWIDFILRLPEVDYFESQNFIAPIYFKEMPIGITDGKKSWQIVEDEDGNLARREFLC